MRIVTISIIGGGRGARCQGVDGAADDPELLFMVLALNSVSICVGGKQQSQAVVVGLFDKKSRLSCDVR